MRIAIPPHMRIAIPTREGRISPVFDVSRELLVMEVKGSRVVKKWKETLKENPSMKGEQIARANIGVIVCGAISQPFAGMLAVRGVRIHPFVAGNIDEVVRAHLAGKLGQARFAMPGCCGRRRGFRGGRGGFGFGWHGPCRAENRVVGFNNNTKRGG